MKLRLIAAGVVLLLLLMPVGLYAVLPFKLFRVHGEWSLARGRWLPGPYGTHERWWYVAPDGVVEVEADFDGDRRADCRERRADELNVPNTVWVKVDGRWEVAPDAVGNCVEVAPEELKAKLRQP